MRFAGAVLFCLAAFVPPAAAQREPLPPVEVSQDTADVSIDQLLQQLGLIGTWAGDCTQEPSPTNPRVSITVPSDGLVVEEHYLGPSYAPNYYNILAAQPLSGDRVALQVIFQPGSQSEERQNLILYVQGGTRRTLYNQPEGGAARVKDGIAVASGRKTPELKKCG